MFKLLICDMDGVLADSEKAWYALFNAALRSISRRPLAKEEFLNVVWTHRLEELAQPYFAMAIEEVRKLFDSHMAVFNENLLAFPDIPHTLQILKGKGVKLAIATNSHSTITENILSRLGIKGYFDAIMTGDKVLHGKPAPDMLLELLKILKVKPEEAIFVGDTDKDRLAAEAAKILFVGVNMAGKGRIKKFSEILTFL